MAIKLLITALYNAVLAAFLYLIDKKTVFRKASFKTKQIIFGVLFGAMAIFSSTNLGGIDIGNGTIMNVRDASPICAGLIFGAPAGILAGKRAGMQVIAVEDDFSKLMKPEKLELADGFIDSYFDIL